MQIVIALLGLGLISGGAYLSMDFLSAGTDDTQSYTATEPGFDPMPSMPELQDIPVGAPQKYTIQELKNWERQPGPVRVGLQIGHLNNQSMPDELENLERNAGASWGGLTEADVNLQIGKLVAAQLEAQGIEVDILEAAVPAGYEADVFASIHADGSSDTGVNGFKFAAPRRDYAGTSHALVEALYAEYERATGLRVDTNITRRMTAYYAFNWPRYEFAIHPFTPAVIIETGFLTSPVDRRVIVDQPQLAADGIAAGILAFLADATIERRPLPTEFVERSTPIVGKVICVPIRLERRSRVSDDQCQPALIDENNHTFLLASYSSTTIVIGEQFEAVGEYVPVQSIPTYFWFPYDVVGVVVDQEQGIVDTWFLR